MKKKYQIIAVFILLAGLALSGRPARIPCDMQPGKGPILDYIDKYPIKMDGGVDFYAYDTGSIRPNHYIFIVSEVSKRAYMNVRGEKDYVFMKKKPRTVLSKTSYKDNFAGSGYEATLTVSQASPVVNYSSRYTGTLEIKHNGTLCVLKVQGKVASY